MGLYVEVMCDERKEWPEGSHRLNHRCYSDRNDNPQGHTVAEARKAARKQQWLVRGSYTVCPGCVETV